MIQLDLGREPQALKRARQLRLPQAIAAYNQYGAGSSELSRVLDQDYDVAKEVLFLRQKKKCAYCERAQGLKFRPTEHFRPKKYAQRALPGQGSQKDDQRYWWLTWTWSNLLFSCHSCNSHKANYFPLRTGTLPSRAPPKPIAWAIAPARFVLCRDAPLLIDPRRVDPIPHLCWKPVDQTRPVSSWSWMLAPSTEEGRATRQILHLDEVTDAVTTRFQETVWPRMRPIQVAVGAGDLTGAQAQWGALAAELLAPEREFRCATWWMFAVMRRHRSMQAAALGVPPRPGGTW